MWWQSVKLETKDIKPSFLITQKQNHLNKNLLSLALKPASINNFPVALHRGAAEKTELRVPSMCRLKLCDYKCVIQSCRAAAKYTATMRNEARLPDIELYLLHHDLAQILMYINAFLSTGLLSSWDTAPFFPCGLNIKRTWGKSQREIFTFTVPSLSAVSSQVKWEGRPDQRGEADLHCLSLSLLKPKKPCHNLRCSKKRFPFRTNYSLQRQMTVHTLVTLV